MQIDRIHSALLDTLPCFKLLGPVDKVALPPLSHNVRLSSEGSQNCDWPYFKREQQIFIGQHK